jgi:predicted HNH restriction endonuclease
VIKLDTRDKRVRSILIRVAQGKLNTHKLGVISYKELWQLISKRKWGRARTEEIVSVIVKISAFELERGRAPLNELVVRKGRQEPGEEWKSIRKHLSRTFKVAAKSSSHIEAQEACWKQWQQRSTKSKGRRQNSEDDDFEAEEGFRQDRTVTFRKRNAKLIADRKRKDNFTCQACGFRLKHLGKFIIDCHHRNPLGHSDKVRIVRIAELVCLCPTCHRIAHMERFPLNPAEIREARKAID